MGRNFKVRALVGFGLLGLLGALSACGSTTTMSEQQKEAVELRRYCERNPEDIVRCLGFLGDH